MIEPGCVAVWWINPDCHAYVRVVQKVAGTGSWVVEDANGTRRVVSGAHLQREV